VLTDAARSRCRTCGERRHPPDRGQRHRENYSLKVPCTVLYGFQTPWMRDISPKIDLVYSCFLEERLYKPLRNKKFHEVSAEIP
jgi:hypothetical protein